MPETIGDRGLRELAKDVQRIIDNCKNRPPHNYEQRELDRCQNAHRILLALGRARVRGEALGREPLKLVQYQMEELAADGLSTECLNPEDIQAIMEANLAQA